MGDSTTIPLGETLRRRAVVLDGGLATLVEKHGHDLSSALWSARLLRDDPGALQRAHAEFYAAGAEVAITASYQASFDGFAAAGIDAAEAELLLRRSCDAADAARSGIDDGRDRWVAASVGPYGAAQADGSEYTGDYGLTVRQLRQWHRPRLQVLMQAVADGRADLLAVETIPSSAEAEAVLAELDGSGIPAWLSLTCADGRTRTGEPAAEAFALASGIDEVIAVGVNCCPADDIAELAAAAVRASGRPAVVYPNSGELWDAQARAWTGAATIDLALVAGWPAAGAALIGGCCRVPPSTISAISELLGTAA
ncbi:homocysteine S-methyltransferase [Nakamurella lactea]|uniref:homocysteine S-methyltransferase n=1 Tax=Nakamurella lactea TaxID=459515 RepID=UPI000426A69F|nr:homocysteine S-methyltransferase [Nakamurella lactea]